METVILHVMSMCMDNIHNICYINYLTKLILVCNDSYLIVTTDTSVMSRSVPGDTPNTPPGSNAVLATSWQITTLYNLMPCVRIIITQF